MLCTRYPRVGSVDELRLRLGAGLYHEAGDWCRWSSSVFLAAAGLPKFPDATMLVGVQGQQLDPRATTPYYPKGQSMIC